MLTDQMVLQTQLGIQAYRTAVVGLYSNCFGCANPYGNFMPSRSRDMDC
jgi:hypothetical protein